MKHNFGLEGLADSKDGTESSMACAPVADYQRLLSPQTEDVLPGRTDGHLTDKPNVVWDTLGRKCKVDRGGQWIRKTQHWKPEELPDDM